MIMLTQHESDKFAAWLEQEAHSYDEMQVQLKKLPGGDLVCDRIRQEVVAYMIVAQNLRSTGRVSIGEDETGHVETPPSRQSNL